MKTKAAVVYERSAKFTIDQIEIAEPKEDEVLVRVVATGICHTDLAGREQYLPIPPARAFPAVFGHEGAGVVEKAGAGVTKVKPGDHVALSWNSCGACPSCLSGNDPYCQNLFLYNFNGPRPDGTTIWRKGDQVIHGPFFSQSSFANFALAN
ncbi:MAG: alcohol dehydrogenase catalytic domain-containing protein, partial [Deltaproteobacteria bacterium]